MRKKTIGFRTYSIKKSKKGMFLQEWRTKRFRRNRSRFYCTVLRGATSRQTGKAQGFTVRDPGLPKETAFVLWVARRDGQPVCAKG